MCVCCMYVCVCVCVFRLSQVDNLNITWTGTRANRSSRPNSVLLALLLGGGLFVVLVESLFLIVQIDVGNPRGCLGAPPPRRY
jgi:hypothetical protein